jgi:hypothetical protein
VPEPTTPPPLYYTGPGKATAPPSPMHPQERATSRAAAQMLEEWAKWEAEQAASRGIG